MPRGDDAEEAVENFKKLAAYRQLGVELTRTLAKEAQDPEVKAAIKKRVRGCGLHEVDEKEVVKDHLKREVVPEVIDAYSEEQPEYSPPGDDLVAMVEQTYLENQIGKDFEKYLASRDFENLLAQVEQTYLEIHIDRGLEYLGEGDYTVSDEKLISDKEAMDLISGRMVT